LARADALVRTPIVSSTSSNRSVPLSIAAQLRPADDDEANEARVHVMAVLVPYVIFITAIYATVT
jgi:hypothetical protein